MTGRGSTPDRCRGDRAVEVVPHQGNFGGFERGVARPYVGMFTRGEQTVGKWRFVVSAVYPRCTIPENDKVNIAL